MGSVSKKFGEGFREHGILALSARYLRAIGLEGPANFVQDYLVNPIANIFDPLPPEIRTRAFKRDLDLAGTSEGQTLPLIMGNKVRVPGALVWVGRVTKNVVSPSGGKGGAQFSGPKATTKADVLFLLCENTIADVTQVRGGGLTIWGSDVEAEVGSTLLSTKAGTTAKNFPKQTITSPKNGPDLTQFEKGKAISLSGWANAGNNGNAWFVIRTKLKKDKTTQLEVKDTTKSKTPVTEAAGASVVINQALSDTKKAIDGAEVMTGSPSQVAPAEIVDFEEHAPAYRNRGGILLKRLRTLKVGGLLNMTFFVKERETCTLEDAVDLIMATKTKRPSSDWDASAISGDTVEGYATIGASAIECLLPLMIAYNFTVIDVEGVLTFQYHGAGSQITVDAGDVATFVVGQDERTGRPATLSVSNPVARPDVVNVSFSDRGNDLLQGIETQTRFGSQGTNEVNIDLTGLALTHAEARAIAKRELYKPEGQATTASLSLPPKYMETKQGDDLLVPIGADIHPLRVGRIEETESFLYNMDTYSTPDGTPYSGPDVTSPGSTDNPGISLEVHAFRSAALFSEHLSVPGFYLVASRTDEGVPWEGAILFKESIDSAGLSTWVPVGSVQEEGIVGFYVESLSTLISFPARGIIDRETELVIEFMSEDASFESVTEDEMLNGANRLQWGDEQIAFQDAEFLGDRQWKFTNLLRGLRDSLGLPGSGPDHNDGELCSLLTAEGLFFRPETVSEVNKMNKYKLVAEDADIDDAEEFEIDLSGNFSNHRGTLTPFSPALIESSNFDDGGLEDIDIRVVRRTRALVHVLRAQEVPLEEEIEKYEVIVQGTGGASRTLFTTSIDFPFSFPFPTFGTSDTVTYTTAQQVADGWSGNGTLVVNVYQHSKSVGRGNVASFLVTSGKTQRIGG